MTELKTKVYDTLGNLEQEMIELRRHFHQYPELSFEEVETPKTITAFHKQLGLEVREHVGERGVVATLKGSRPGPTIAIRADFDALPIKEETNLSYQSTVDGVMHACGHDAHTAIAMTVAKALVSVKDDLHGTVKFIHQHAEEQDPGGAKAMIEDGAIDGIDQIFCLHMENYLPVGTIGETDGPILGASDDFFITIEGKGGHAALPHDTVDALSIGAQIVTQLNQLTSRKVDPMKQAVLTVGSFHSGDKANVIAEKAYIEGTVRTFDETVRQEMSEWVKKVTDFTARAHGAKATIDYQFGYPATINDQETNQLMVDVAKGIIGERNVIHLEPNMGAEDFSYFAEQIPATYFFLGSANEEKGCIHPYHHPKFMIDEDSLLIGAKILAGSILTALKK